MLFRSGGDDVGLPVAIEVGAPKNGIQQVGCDSVRRSEATVTLGQKHDQKAGLDIFSNNGEGEIVLAVAIDIHGHNSRSVIAHIDNHVECGNDRRLKRTIAFSQQHRKLLDQTVATRNGKVGYMIAVEVAGDDLRDDGPAWTASGKLCYLKRRLERGGLGVEQRSRERQA